MGMMMQSPPTTAELLSYASVYKAVRDFEILVMQPPIEASHVLAGNQNNITLPPDREYVINSVVSHREIGTPVESYEWDEEAQAMRVVISRLVEMVMQVDAYRDGLEAARMRAECVATVARTTPACDFFRKYDISSLYADDVRNTTTVVDEDQFVQRWTTSLHLTYTHKVRLDVDSISAVTVGVQNVDVRFPQN